MLWPLLSKKAPAVSSADPPLEAPRASPVSSTGDLSDVLSAVAADVPAGQDRGSAASVASEADGVPTVEGTMNFMLYTDVTRSAEELEGALENLASAADNFIYTYEALSNVKRTGGDVEPNAERDLALMIEFARHLSEVNRNLASTLQRSITGPLKKDYNACSTVVKSTIQGNDKKMASVVKEMRVLEAKSHRERKKKNRDAATYDSHVRQLRMMGAEVQGLHSEKETKADELARASLPFILNSSRAAVLAVTEHYVPFANAVVKLLTLDR